MDHLGGLCLTILLILTCMPSRTESQKDYVIDTLVVLDAEALSGWVKREPSEMSLSDRQAEAKKKVKEYVSLVIRETNIRLTTLTDQQSIDWTIQLSVAGFAIGEDPLAGIAKNQVVSSDAAIETTKQWVVNQGYNTQYDYVILLTGYDLQGGASNPVSFVKGITVIRGLCQLDGSSVTIVEDNGGFQSVIIVAHELGHSLGAIHDGDSSASGCPNDGRYIMSINSPDETSSNRLNPWRFSTCSKSAIKTFMDKTVQDHLSCLEDTKSPAPEYSATENKLPGQLYSGGKQCLHLSGDDSKLCLGKPFGDLSDICTKMYCLQPTPGSDEVGCKRYRAAEGTCCGDGKMCQSGQCLESPLAPSTCEDSCLDSPVKVNGFSCEESVNLQPQVCYEPKILAACCRSCAKIEKQSDVCPYGDKNTGCNPDHCKLIDVDGTRYEDVCCGTCAYDVVKTCSDEPLVDNMPCEERVRLNDFQRCYDPALAYKCCKTCQDLRTSTKDCEYGDRDLSSKCQATNLSNQTCIKEGANCCYTCNNLPRSGATSSLKTNSLLLFQLLIMFLVSIHCILT